MVKSRKEKETYLGQNLRFLRDQKGKTLEEMARLLDLSGKSSYKAYESEDALPDIHKLMKLASYFEVAVAELVYQDIENIKHKTIEVKLFEVPKVPVAAAAGYSKSFGDSKFVKKLKTIKIPFEPYGIARAFDIDGDSMEPEIKSGSTIVGIKVNANEIKDNKPYIIVTTEGVQCKYIRIENDSEVIYLLSANAKYLPRHIYKGDVKEVWEVWKKI